MDWFLNSIINIIINTTFAIFTDCCELEISLKIISVVKCKAQLTCYMQLHITYAATHNDLLCQCSCYANLVRCSFSNIIPDIFPINIATNKS